MPALERSPVLVTGAGGFIGTAVVAALADRGAAVHALLGPQDQPVDPVRAVETKVADIMDSEALRQLAAGCRVAVHLAGPASVRESFRAPGEYVRVHVGGTAAFLDACAKGGIERVVYISSAEVYGRPERNPVDETAPLEPRSPYAAAKAGAEHLIGMHARSVGIEAVVLRPFSIYGPRLSPKSVISTVVRAACVGGPVVVADLRPVRDYCYVEDLARAIVLACMSDASGVFNIGSGAGVSVLELVRTILELADISAQVRTLPDPQRPPGADIGCLVADIRRAGEVLAWSPQVSLEAGLRCTIEWARAGTS